MSGKQVALTYLLIGLLLIIAITTAAVLAIVNLADTAILGWTLAAAIVLTALARPFRGAGILVTIIGSAVYVAAELDRILTLGGLELHANNLSMAVLRGAGVQFRDLAEIALAVACLVVLGGLGSLVGMRLRKIDLKIHHDNAAIQELTIHENLTGTMKRVYLETTLAGEVERARRYKRCFSLVMLGADDWASVSRDRGPEGSRQLLEAIGDILVKGLRSMDSAARYDDSRYLVVVPETPAAGAQVVADRLCRDIMALTSVRFRAGVAEFPSDAVSQEDLIGEAEAALEFARNADITVASRAVLA